MALLIADSFNRANSTSLGSTDGAGNLDPVAWTDIAGDLRIISNLVKPNGTPTHAVSVVETAHANVDVRLSLGAIGGAGGASYGIVIRCSDATNYIGVVQTQPGDLQVFKMAAGVKTSLINITSPGFSTPSPLRVIAINNVITVYVNGVIKTRVIESFNRSATKCGMYFHNEINYEADDFAVHNIPNLPAELVTDSFNRINGSIGSTDGVGSLDPVAWSALTGSNNISSNKAVVGSTTTIDPLSNGFTSSTGANIGFIDVGTPDVQIYLKADFVSNSVVGIVFRYVDSNNYWLLYLSQTSNNVYLFRRVGGVWTNVSGTLAGLGTGKIYSVKTSGSTIIIEQNGIVLYTLVSTVLQSATKHGFEVGGGGEVDTFQLWEGDVPQPVIAQVGPTQGPSGGGTDVTIVGNNFIDVDEVSFGSSPATSFTVLSDGYVECIAPAHTAGLVHIILSNPNGDSEQTSNDLFAFVNPRPSVASVTPNHGPPAGGTSVVITGAYFTGTTSVKFGTVEATSFTVNNDGQITATSPSHTQGVKPVVVTTPWGSNV